jgi:hypothetical protein
MGDPLVVHTTFRLKEIDIGIVNCWLITGSSDLEQIDNPQA